MKQITEYEGVIYSGHIFKGLDKITGSDALHPFMCQAIIEEGNIVATDSLHLVVIPLRFFGLGDEAVGKLEGKAISREVLQKLGSLKKDQKWGVTDEGIVVLRPGTSKISLIYPLGSKDEEGKYVNYKAVIPNIENKTPVGKFFIEPKLISNVQAVYENYKDPSVADFTFLESYGATKAFMFKTDKTDFVGLIMPKKVSK